MKRYFLYIVLLALGACQQDKKAILPSLNETFDKDDKKPFGGFVAYRQTKQIFNDSYIETITEPFDESLNKMTAYDADDPSLYLIISKNLPLSEEESEALLGFIKAGNDVFISADYIDETFLDKIGLHLKRDTEFIKEVNGIMEQTFININDSSGKKNFSYYYYPFLNALSSEDPNSIHVLGSNHAGEPNYIVKLMDKGRLYLHVAPRSLGNYFLLTKDNHSYLQNVMSYLRRNPDNIYWDAYYQQKGARQKSSGSDESAEEEFSSFDVIMQNPALRGAFLVGLFALLLYVLFNIKRKQRTIREIPPLMNNTVAFTETVGRLYLQKKNNRNIAEKMITYFYEYIRNRYYLNTARINEELLVSLAGKSGMDIHNIRNLFTLIHEIHERQEIDDKELLLLNSQIQNFYKTKS